MKTAIMSIALLACSSAPAQTPNASCRGLDALIGDWIGTGGGQPGQASAGESSFQRDLQNKILVRRGFAKYPATRTSPAYRHDDLMIVYEDPSKATRAVYFDNEGHVIHYDVSTSSDGCTVVFVNPASSSAPGYRLTYATGKPDRLGMKFEIAPPGRAFALYLEALLQRK